MKPIVSTDNGGDSFAQVIEQQTEIIEHYINYINYIYYINSANSLRIDTRVKLPTINLSTFSREIEDWTRFTFIAVIHNSEPLAIQKLQYLVGALDGKRGKNHWVNRDFSTELQDGLESSKESLQRQKGIKAKTLSMFVWDTQGRARIIHRHSGIG